jgi:hypothetical protein
LNEARPPRRKLRSIGAVLAGMVAIIALSLATDSILHFAGWLPPAGEPLSDRALLLATVYRTAFAVLGSFVAARLAPARPMAHALALGAVGAVLAAVGMAATWDRGPELGSHWYPIALIALALPAAWAGGKLAGRSPSAG